jgi:hypothetical protein
VGRTRAEVNDGTISTVGRGFGAGWTLLFSRFFGVSRYDLAGSMEHRYFAIDPSWPANTDMTGGC